MNNDLNNVTTKKINIESFFEIQVVMGLTCIMIILEVINALIAFA